MSAGFAVRSLGRPYFAFRQQSLAGMSGSPIYSGPVEAVLEFMLHAFPPTISAANEIHPLFSFHEYGPSGGVLMDVGVSPDGAVRASNAHGTVAQSRPGLVFPNNAWHRVVFAYDGGTGDYVLTLDGMTVDSGTDAGGFLLPSSGRIAEMMLFNNREAASLADASLRFASVSSTDGAARTISWLLVDRGGTLAPTVAAGDFPGVDATLAAVYHNPITTLPHGPVPDDSPADAYSWWLYTDWSEEVGADTVWSEEVAGA